MKLQKPPVRNFQRDEQVVRKLSPEQFRVTQRSGTERPGTGAYLHNEEPGIYVERRLRRAAVRFVAQI